MTLHAVPAKSESDSMTFEAHRRVSNGFLSPVIFDYHIPMNPRVTVTDLNGLAAQLHGTGNEQR